MASNYNFDPALVDEAIGHAKNASLYVEPMSDNISKAKSYSSLVKVDGLEFLNNGEITDNLTAVSEYDATITQIKTEALKSMMSYDNFQEQLVIWANEGKITPAQFMVVG